MSAIPQLEGFDAGVLLASASQRRVQLLMQMALPVRAIPVDIDERARVGELPRDYVQRMAERKLDAAFERFGGWLLSDKSRQRVLLAADTVVVADGELLGKPTQDEQARAMLLRLSGRHHQVLTRVAVAVGQDRAAATNCVQVTFRELSSDDIDGYLATGEGRDKAGGYGIQGIGGIFAEHISGSYSAVVGLPVATVEALLSRLGVATWRLRSHG